MIQFKYSINKKYFYDNPQILILTIKFNIND